VRCGTKQYVPRPADESSDQAVRQQLAEMEMGFALSQKQQIGINK
jgi:hypothetical protein